MQREEEYDWEQFVQIPQLGNYPSPEEEHAHWNNERRRSLQAWMLPLPVIQYKPCNRCNHENRSDAVSSEQEVHVHEEMEIHCVPGIAGKG